MTLTRKFGNNTFIYDETIRLDKRAGTIGEQQLLIGDYQLTPLHSFLTTHYSPLTIHETLFRYWGYEAFRPQQQEIIESVLAGNDTLALLPTGGGKSLCYQVPALSQEGLCLVVSPLIALMKDQVEALKKKGIGALLIYSGMGRKDVIRTLENARQSYFKFLYVSPERLETALFREYLPALTINLIAVDEAHCISQWGNDFRPAYLRIATLREELPDVPILAVTASATRAVQKHICEQLKFEKPVVFRLPFERLNISYVVEQADSKSTRLVQILKKVPGSALVYCKSRRRTSEISALLQMHGFSAAHYHAGLSSDERSKRQLDWVENRCRVMVCTNAFGMGIDKPDVRLVIHADVPDSLENYYQEAGRCGRDGKPSYAVLVYHQNDLDELQNLHLIRYPDVETVRLVYDALVNFLSIPVNHGGDESFAFRFEEFVRNFKLNAATTLYALQALESDGWLSYSEKAFAPATVVFTTSKDRLYEFYKAHPEHENLLTAMLRMYEGIFDFPAFVSVQTIARLLKKEDSEIQSELLKVTTYGIIRFTPQNDDPQLFFRKNRVAKADLKINELNYRQRKEAFQHRVLQMLHYCNLSVCRSRFISQYFGEENAPLCGTCDYCRRQKRKTLSVQEFEKIAAIIQNTLLHQPLMVDQLMQALAPLAKEKIWEVIRFLETEKKISSNSEGFLQFHVR